LGGGQEGGQRQGELFDLFSFLFFLV